MWNNPGGFDGDFSGTTGGAGGGSGGGFMNTTAQFGSPAAKKERRSQNIIATTVKCILDCQEESFTIEGTEVNMVCLVGIIRSVDISSTKISYTLDDHTGVIDVLRYPEGDAVSHTCLVKSHSRSSCIVNNFHGCQFIINGNLSQRMRRKENYILD
ncbi:Nucleic acid-binding OB-fold [Trinorchestia longiramus]|nr:Nucleic acid-binding OB-fold [Trinorchestia longiramus]